MQIESPVGAVRVLVTHQRPAFVSGAWVVDRGRFGWVEPLSLALFALAAGACLYVASRRQRSDISWVCLAGGLVAGLMLCSRLLSPQYLTWLLPFMALAWIGGHRRLGLLYQVIVAMTIGLLLDYTAFVRGSELLAAVMVVRNVLLAVLAVGLCWAGVAD